MKRLGLLPPTLTNVVVPGAGVDMERHRVLPLPPLNQGLPSLSDCDKTLIHDWIQNGAQP